MQTSLVVPRQWREPVWTAIGPNERCVEFPVAAGFLQLNRPGSILDAGCALNQDIKGPFVATLTHFTQSMKREKQQPSERRRYLEGDLRDLSQFADRTFDRVLCMSTLEHIGCDNSRYAAPIENCPETIGLAAAELWRVTKQGLLFSVPFRLTYWRERGWQYLTPESLLAIAPPTADVTFYRKAEDATWSGPYDEAIVTAFDDEPWRVSQIAVVYACR